MIIPKWYNNNIPIWYIYAEGEDFMGLVEAKCTQCGANITVDSSKDAEICPHLLLLSVEIVF